MFPNWAAKSCGDSVIRKESDVFHNIVYRPPISEYIYEPEEEGYTFLGWIGETYATMPAHDVTYTANIDNGIS
ncbi:MAG: hypothetical protein IJE15_06930 [Bacteroidaceae bacterium]|nr:hypothetical protein [Bacteroidaceae bacterium]